MVVMKCKRPFKVGSSYRRCNSSVYSVCPSCAGVLRKEYDNIFERGVSNKYYYVNCVLTAPSFGKLHKGGDACDCGIEHDGRYDYTNVDSYNFKRQVEFNNNFNKLLSYTIKKFKKFSVIDGYVVGREWQARGVLHAHLLFRFESMGELVKFVDRFEGLDRLSFKGFSWGSESFINILNDSVDSVLSVGRYSLKGLGFSTSFRAGLKRVSREREVFINCLNDSVDSDWSEAEMANLGWSGRPVTFSHGWALDGSTLKQLKQERSNWAKNNYDIKSIKEHNNILENTYNVNNQIYSSSVLRQGEINRTNNLLEKLGII